MDFGKELTNYMELLDCSTKELCKESGISYSLLNRYINNKRIPKQDSVYLEKLISGLYTISVKKNIKLDKLSISDTLKKYISNNSININFDIFVENFITLQNTLCITNVDLSKAVGYDSSFISRIKKKEREPTNIENFIDKLIVYIISLCQNKQKVIKLADLLNCSVNDIENNDVLAKELAEWLSLKHSIKQTNSVLSFLSKLDTFDLNDYIGTDFSKIKVPTTPIIFKNSKTFFGINGRKQAESEFLKMTLLSKSTEPIFYYSDLPMSTAGNDEEFKKKWVLAMTMLLKRGLHLNIIHTLDRPINELLLGLENWIPIYMTGSISPYYFKKNPSNYFQCSHGTSGSIALSGECLKNKESLSKFYLTTKKDEVNFEKEKSKILLSEATPLMKIYKLSDKEDFYKFIESEPNKNYTVVKKSNFKNIDFFINDTKWIIINKKTVPEIHFVIYHEKLIKVIKDFL